jgi:hypothetical protein
MNRISSNILSLAPLTKVADKLKIGFGGLLVVVAFAAYSSNVAAKYNDKDKVQELEIAELYIALMQDMPESARLTNSPYPQAFTSYGSKTKIDEKSIIKGGRALRVKIKKASKKSYSKGSSNKTIEDINAGDTLCLTFWARSINAPEKNLTAEFSDLGVQESAEPYENIMNVSAIKLGYEWQQFAFKAIANKSKKAGEAQVFFQYGHLAQRLEIGPTYLFNLGKKIDSDFKSNACGK